MQMTDTQMMKIAIAVFNYAKTKCKHKKLSQQDLLKVLHTVSQLLSNFVNIEMMKLYEKDQKIKSDTLEKVIMDNAVSDIPYNNGTVL